MKLQQGMTVLFQGDSITDAGRDRADLHSLSGYTQMIAEGLSALGVACFNRGVSGDRTKDALARMESDLREIKPDLVTVLLGINDTWRRFDEAKEATSAEAFERNYRGILELAKKSVGQIVLFEPFLIPLDPQKDVMHADLDEKIAVVRKLAREYATDFIPLDGLFAEAAVRRPLSDFTADGVHPNEGGNRLIADAFLSRLETC